MAVSYHIDSADEARVRIRTMIEAHTSTQDRNKPAEFHLERARANVRDADLKLQARESTGAIWASAHHLEKAWIDYMVGIAKRLENGRIDKDSTLKFFECMRRRDELMSLLDERKGNPPEAGHYKKWAGIDLGKIKQLQDAQSETEIIRIINEHFFGKDVLSPAVLKQLRGA